MIQFIYIFLLRDVNKISTLYIKHLMLLILTLTQTFLALVHLGNMKMYICL